jgi:sulfate transport system ATP-binding protein
VVLTRGRIERMGPPQELYENPATPFVTRFLGNVNVLSLADAAGHAGRGVPEIYLAGHDGNGDSSIYVRPHDLDLTYERNGGSAWSCRLLRVIPLGGLIRLDVALSDGTAVRVELSRERFAELEPRVGESLYLSPRDPGAFRDRAIRA